MTEKCFEFLKKDDFKLILTPIEQVQGKIDEINNAMTLIKDAMKGNSNVFEKELSTRLLAHLANHTVKYSPGVKFKYGLFYYKAEHLDDRIAEADSRCRNCKEKFYTDSKSNIAASYIYNKCENWLIYDEVKLCDDAQFANFCPEPKLDEDLYASIREALEELPYNAEIPKTDVCFIFRLIENLGFAGVIYKSKMTDENVWVVFKPEKYMKKLEHKVIYPADYRKFFMSNN